MNNNIRRRQFELLLQEAITANHYVAVKMLLEEESMVSSKETEKNPYRHEQRYSLPLIKAASSGNCAIIKLLLKHQYSISPLHAINCYCDRCQSDKLSQTKYRLTTLKALSNPIWIALTSDDIFLTLFQINQKNDVFSKQDDSFEEDYRKIIEENEKLCMDLLNEIKTERRGNILMRHRTCDVEESSGVPFITLAIDYEQKEIVAHPIIQHFLTSRVFDDIPGWRAGSIPYKLLIVTLIVIMWPVTTSVNILLPFNCCSKVADIAMKPLVKFINGAASFITFLCLLVAIGVSDRCGVRIGDPPTVLDIAIFTWLLGFCFGELKQLYKRGARDYLRSGWNWVDLSMDAFMLFSSITWMVCASKISAFYETMMYLADGAFSAAIILSFFRIIYLCQITSYLGLLQLCLGKMIKVILQTAFICIIVLLSFSVAMMFLYHASRHHNIRFHNGTRLDMFETELRNSSDIYNALTQNFNGFWSTMHTMGWFSVGMREIDTLKEFADGTLIHLWANLLYIVYFGITMIVVLNMLIAMMNQSYQKISDNILTEHKYARTSLWLEYVGDEQTRPVPFNLVPNKDSVIKIISYLKNTWHHYRCPVKKSECDCENGALTLQEETNRQYTQLCNSLINKYILKRYGLAINDDRPDNHGNIDDDDPMIQKIQHYFNLCRSAENENESPMEDFGYAPESLQYSFDDDDVISGWNEFLSV